MLPTVMIAEDDAPLRDVLRRSLRAEGFEVSAVATGRELIDRVRERVPDLLVIDIGLPDGDGRDVCQSLRAQGVSAPVMFLTARDALTDRLTGFSAGADDYVTKPFEIEEVCARLRALARRAGPAEPPADDSILFDPTELTVSSQGMTQTLTPTEFRLLAALAARRGRTLARRELVLAGWPHGAIVHENTLDVYIARARRKLRALPGTPEIVTIHGLGYRMP